MYLILYGNITLVYVTISVCRGCWEISVNADKVLRDMVSILHVCRVMNEHTQPLLSYDLYRDRGAWLQLVFLTTALWLQFQVANPICWWSVIIYRLCGVYGTIHWFIFIQYMFQLYGFVFFFFCLHVVWTYRVDWVFLSASRSCDVLWEPSPPCPLLDVGD